MSCVSSAAWRHAGARNVHRIEPLTAAIGRDYGTCAPALFAQEDEAKRVNLHIRDLETAMRRLFAAGNIWNEPYGRSTRPYAGSLAKSDVRMPCTRARVRTSQGRDSPSRRSVRLETS